MRRLAVGQVLAPVSSVATTAVADWRMNHGFLPGLQARFCREIPLWSSEGSSCFTETLPAGALQVADYELPPVQASLEE